MRRLNDAAAVDILVIGLGPAGASAAAVAAGAGCKVLAIDRKIEAGLPVQCAEFVPAMIGLEMGGAAATRLQAIGAMDTFVEGDGPEHTPDFRGTMISRADFDRRLVAEATAAGADCRFDVVVREIAGDGRVTLASGAEIAPRLIIGADGPRSLAGRAIGRVNRDCVESRQVTVPLLASHDATDIFLSADIPGGYGWLFPKNDRANLGLGVAPGWKHLLKPELERLHRRLVGEGRVGADVLGLTGGLIPVGGMLDPVGRRGDTIVLLAGDAAGLTNPITGAGVPAAVMSGAMAGRAAADLIGGKTRAATDYAEELDDIFGPSLTRALGHRAALLRRFAEGGRPSPDDLRATWIAYPQYWAAPDKETHA
jgi:digeranylgeranylglycerophospholipid reductase